jgi:hypothetical protein
MLTISKFESDYNSNTYSQFFIVVEFYLDRKKDAFILQDLIRAKMHQFCVESYFGYDEDLNEILEIEYSCKPYLNSMIINYNSETQEMNYLLKKRKTTSFIDNKDL